MQTGEKRGKLRAPQRWREVGAKFAHLNESLSRFVRLTISMRSDDCNLRKCIQGIPWVVFRGFPGTKTLGVPVADMRGLPYAMYKYENLTNEFWTCIRG